MFSKSNSPHFTIHNLLEIIYEASLDKILIKVKITFEDHLNIFLEMNLTLNFMSSKYGEIDFSLNNKSLYFSKEKTESTRFSKSNMKVPKCHPVKIHQEKQHWKDQVYKNRRNLANAITLASSNEFLLSAVCTVHSAAGKDVDTAVWCC